MCVLRVNFRAPILFHGPVELRSSQYERFKVFYLIIILENLIKPAFEDDWKIQVVKFWYSNDSKKKASLLKFVNICDVAHINWNGDAKNGIEVIRLICIIKFFKIVKIVISLDRNVSLRRNFVSYFIIFSCCDEEKGHFQFVKYDLPINDFSNFHQRHSWIRWLSTVDLLLLLMRGDIPIFLYKSLIPVYAIK